MNRQKKIASVLAGVSFIALSVAASPAMSAGTRQGTQAPGTTVNAPFAGNWLFSNDGGANGFIEIDGAAITGDVTVDEDIGNIPGQWNDTGIEIDNGGSIGGDLIINSGVDVGANVYITEGPGVDATTSVAGIYIHDDGQIGGDIINNGSVTGDARANAPDNANALAFGVGSTSDDNPAVFNYGNIGATAQATAYDSAFALAGGVGQVDGGSDQETARIYNEGSLTASATALSINEQFDYSTDQAIALAFGAGQFIDAVTAVAYVTNVGGASIEANAIASAYDSQNPTLALGAAAGIGQITVGDASAAGYVQNDGTVSTFVEASAYSGEDNASAIGVGIGSLQAATSGGNASVDLVNNSEIGADVSAFATSLSVYDTGTAIAVAAGLGNVQLAISSAPGSVASAAALNAGTISAVAFASAYASSADAIANADALGNVQAALGDQADVYMDNSGDITATATANSFSPEDDATSVAIGLGSLQAAIGYSTATADLVNTNTIGADVTAYATGLGANDTASAIAAGIGNVQLAIATGPGSVASASTLNSGTISAAAFASAYGSTAFANADALGNVQAAIGGQADAYMDNSGDINVNATSNANGGFAGASYAVAGGLLQAAIAYEESATATLNNTNGIDVTADSYAEGVFAVAEAWGFGAAQIAVAYGTGDATAALTNTSMNSIDVLAEAYATGVFATADAYDFGAAQIAVAVGGGTASTLANNSGRIDAYASAIAHGSVAAYAEADAAGLNQLALGLQSDVYLENTGVIEANASAQADADEAQAGAQAIGVLQLSNAAPFPMMTPLGIVSDALIHNDDLITAVASASATAYDGDAWAYATATGAGQVAGGFDANATVRNVGTISGEANANAYATDDATATAAAVGLGQYAFGTVADAVIYNEGTISASATAKATAGDTASAYAYATGVDQGAGATIATVWLQNSATITANALATAYTTDDDATATATAAGVRQDVGGSTSFATLDNSSSITATATAYATELNGWDANASANATGVDQELGADGVATGSVINSSNITAVASAFAYSTDEDADADGEAYGVSQYVDAGVGFLDLYNTGSITATGNADARAYDDADASASASGVEQYANGLNATLTVTNHNSITAVANASAYSTDDDADASADAQGVYQYLDVDGAAVADLFNDATISAAAYATATAWDQADADATGEGLDQEAYGSVATLTATNQGTISAFAGAKALSLDDDADASATATGVSQEAYVSGAASIDFYNDNNGTVSALASATGTAWDDADGSAEATGLYQYASGTFALATATNHGVISAVANGNAYATYGEAEADAEATGVDQYAYANDNGSASVDLFNDGSITASAGAIATAYESADASASATGVYQYAYGGVASASLTNLGDITATADANAKSSYNDADGSASATGVYQYAEYGTATVDLYNDGVISATAKSYATALYEADSEADAMGVDQEASGYLNDITATNHRDITAFALAYATSTSDSASATASATGVAQSATYGSGSTSTIDLVNSGDISATGKAVAEAYTSASAEAYAYGAYQDVRGDIGTLTAMNSGSISALADAKAQSAVSSAYASATGVGFGQYVNTLMGSADLYNEGNITAVMYADADAKDGALAFASASGVEQVGGYNDMISHTLDLSVTNHSLISGFADAQATSTDGYATGVAEATGVYQGNFALYGSVSLDNHGDILATAFASADGELGDLAVAGAFGHNVQVGGPYGFISTPTIDVVNEDGALISAYADASADDEAYALAMGASYAGYATLNGTIFNAGEINGAAFADVYDGGTGTASAFGVVEVSEGANNTTLTNTGTIRAYAEGPNAYATGIAIGSFAPEPIIVPQILAEAPAEAPLFLLPIDPDPVTGLATVNNDGGVIEARYSTDGGETVHRGNAINTRGFVLLGGLDPVVVNAAPNPVQFNFTGGEAGSDGKAYAIANNRVSPAVQSALAGYSSWGYVLGDIMLTPDDNVSVTDGVTIFDGQFNADGLNNGDLTIDDDGKLVLVQPFLEGDAQAGGYVDDFTVGSSGSLVYELTTSDAPGDYASIDANTASLDGRVVAVYNPGLYGDSMYYDNVIDADARTGEFASVEDNSLLLVTEAVYDDENNVDLAVERTAFNEVDGLTKNQKAVGGGIEKVYPKINENTDFGRMVTSLFTLGDGDYQDFLDQLSGAEFANHLASVLWSTRAIDRIITDRMECTPDSAYQRAADNSSVRVDGSTVTPTADVISSTGCFRPGEANIWMSGTGQWNELSGDRNAPGYDETQYGIFFGADYAFNEVLFAGIAGGYFDSQGDFDKWGGRSGSTIDYDGLQLAAYGGYDNATYYLRGIVAYGNYDGDSHRQIKFPGSAEIDPSGSPSSDTWSFYGETGYRFGMMSAGQITPFLGLSIASANLDGFTEKDPNGTGAALKIHDSDASSVASVLGARFTGDWAMASGVFSPVLSVAWMHEFGDTAQEVNMSFAGAPKGANFKVVGSEVARDSAVVDAGARFLVSDSFDLGLFYNGQFNADYTSNGVTATLGYRF